MRRARYQPLALVLVAVALVVPALLVLSEVRRLASSALAEQILADAAAHLPRSGVCRIQMTMVSRWGDERTRALEVRFRRDGEITKVWWGLTEPPELDGAQLLLVDHPMQVDPMLSYLPAYKLAVTISGSSRTGSFVGSDFIFEDLEILGGGVSRPELIEERSDAWIMGTRPPDSSYTQVRTTYRRSDLAAERFELYDAEGLRKVMDVTHAPESCAEVVMRDLRRGSHTRLGVRSSQLNVPLADETFTRAFLEREGVGGSQRWPWFLRERRTHDGFRERVRGVASPDSNRAR